MWVLGMFKSNPFPDRKSMEAVLQGRDDLTYRQITDWFERHRRKNNLKNPRTSGRGRPRGRPRGTGRGGRPIGNRSSGEDSASLSSAASHGPDPREQPVRRGRGRPRGIQSSMSRKRRKGRGWVHDDDENDYGSTTSEEDEGQDLMVSAQGETPLSPQPDSALSLNEVNEDVEEGDTSDLTDLLSADLDGDGSHTSWRADDAARQASHERSVLRRPQHPITTFTVRHIAGSRPLTYFNRQPPPEIEAAYRAAAETVVHTVQHGTHEQERFERAFGDRRYQELTNHLRSNGPSSTYSEATVPSRTEWSH